MISMEPNKPQVISIFPCHIYIIHIYKLHSQCIVSQIQIIIIQSYILSLFLFPTMVTPFWFPCKYGFLHEKLYPCLLVPTLEKFQLSIQDGFHHSINYRDTQDYWFIGLCGTTINKRANGEMKKFGLMQHKPNLNMTTYRLETIKLCIGKEQCLQDRWRTNIYDW